MAVGTALVTPDAIERGGVDDDKARHARGAGRVLAVGAVVDGHHVRVAADHQEPRRQAKAEDVIRNHRALRVIRRPPLARSLVVLRDPRHRVRPDDERRTSAGRLELGKKPLALCLPQHGHRRGAPRGGRLASGSTVGQDDAHASHIEGLLERARRAAGQGMVRHVLAEDAVGGRRTRRVAVGLVATVVMVVPHIGNRHVAIERALPRRHQAPIEGRAEPRRVVPRDVTVVHVAHVDENVRLNRSHRVPDRGIRSSARAGSKQDDGVVRPLGGRSEPANGAPGDPALQDHIAVGRGRAQRRDFETDDAGRPIEAGGFDARSQAAAGWLDLQLDGRRTARDLRHDRRRLCRDGAGPHPPDDTSGIRRLSGRSGSTAPRPPGANDERGERRHSEEPLSPVHGNGVSVARRDAGSRADQTGRSYRLGRSARRDGHCGGEASNLRGATSSWTCGHAASAPPRVARVRGWTWPWRRRAAGARRRRPCAPRGPPGCPLHRRRRAG